MARLLIAILIVCYAITFAFGAMAAIRWPSLMMLVPLILQDDPMQGMAQVNWREIGMAFGAPYFLAALCLYASALSVSQKQHGGFSWYIMGCVAGFPCVFLAEFSQGWWLDPDSVEGAVAGAAAGAVLLGIAVWSLRKRKPRAVAEVAAEALAADPEKIVSLTKEREQKQIKRRGPVPAAIARQRAHFAQEGRRMRARQRRG